YSTTLSRMIISVGMELMPNEAASSCWASVSTLPNTASGYSSDACSKIGPNMRQGPHHAAQKSTSARSAPPITDSKFSAVSSTVAIGASSAAQGISLRYPAGYRTRAHPRPFPAAGLPPGARRAPHRPAPPTTMIVAVFMPRAGAVARERGPAAPSERHDHGLRRAVQLDAPPRRRGLGERFGPGELFVHTHGVEVPGLSLRDVELRQHEPEPPPAGVDGLPQRNGDDGAQRRLVAGDLRIGEAPLGGAAVAIGQRGNPRGYADGVFDLDVVVPEHKVVSGHGSSISEGTPGRQQPWPTPRIRGAARRD